MPIDPKKPVVLLCAAGMERDGEPDEARRLFQQAWDARRNDYDAAIAAHYLARHQLSPHETLRWNSLAVTHAERVADGRTTELFPSLYLNRASSQRTMASQADVRRIALSFPETEEGDDRFAFSVRNRDKLKGFAWVWME